ncbi:serine/threonine protein kinase [Paraburkholderia aspalathi]|uniref:Protein kinase domain-containing protein n=1 Tax=Paraburkholderia aspalathi TaxID=1324617 RepID=A0A1I7AB85_9BURK|nr:protein kinase [Paraburkholderia aspalathi]SFT72181.1 Protein kinase domain-containing protein [Paraburkholderia aspalathi]
MATTYGDRWILGGSLGGGGQGDVFHASDRSGQYPDPVALKRLRNRNREDRFIREIEAIQRVDHEHVVKLIDHSPISDDPKQSLYIVMPLAAGGDLSRRVLAYKDSLDSTLIVARQLASALAAAHGAGVVHRDVKPQNVLFRDVGQHALLTDFGICYMHADDRITPVDEAVGPRIFMAPEMEGGRIIDVRPAADVYSLGKLIYYMISGGVLLPREAIHEEPYAQVFAQGGRYHLLRMLLGKMICLEDRRLKSMTEVASELEQIASWEARAQITPLTSTSLDAIKRLQQRELDAQRVIAENQETRRTETEVLGSTQRSLMDWLMVQLQQIRDTAHVDGVFECAVQEATVPGALPYSNQTSMLKALSGIELCVTRPQATFHKIETLQFLLCQVWRPFITVGDQPRKRPMEDAELVFLPYYVRPPLRTPPNLTWGGYLTSTSHRSVRTPGHRGGAALHIHKSFVGQGYTLFHAFRASQWPGVRPDLTVVMGDAFDTFCDYLLQGASSIGN